MNIMTEYHENIARALRDSLDFPIVVDDWGILVKTTPGANYYLTKMALINWRLIEGMVLHGAERIAGAHCRNNLWRHRLERGRGLRAEGLDKVSRGRPVRTRKVRMGRRRR
jgi:hypothetical protein